jgi:uncharacterized SAM-binding protein YcdF (DUF218 family)
MSCAIVVLGSPNDENGNLLPIALSRCEKVLSEFKKNSNYKVLCTGGFGQHFNSTQIPHGNYVKAYLEANGVPESSFLDVALSSFTLEDATLSRPILIKNSISHIVLVTSEFHMERAKLVFNHALPEFNFSYSQAETKVSDSEFQRLTKHEKNAIKRELANIQS